jgi:two-component system response regulator DctR
MKSSSQNSSVGTQVFVVEDDDEVADLYGTLLTSIALPHRRFACGETFLEAWQPDWYGAVILDLRMPGIGGMGVLEGLRERRSSLVTVVVTGFGEIQSAVDAMRHGALNYLEKPFSNQSLLSNVRNAIEVSSARHTANHRFQELDRRFAAMSPREAQVAHLVTQGLTSREIANELDISLRTVEVHRANVLETLGCDNSVQLAKLAAEWDAGKKAVS